MITISRKDDPLERDRSPYDLLEYTVDVAEDVWHDSDIWYISGQRHFYFQAYNEALHVKCSLLKGKFDYSPCNFRFLKAHMGHTEGKRTSLSKILGFRPENGWYYADKRVLTPVDEWIEQHQQNHDVLVIAGCNPSSIRLTPAQCYLIYPAEIYHEVFTMWSEQMRVLPPQKDRPVERFHPDKYSSLLLNFEFSHAYNAPPGK